MDQAVQTPTTAITEIERFQLFIAGITGYAICMLTTDGVVHSWNAGAERCHGYRADEIIGQHFSCFYTHEDRVRGVPAQALNTALQYGKFEDEGRRMRKDGTLFWANVVIDPIYSPRGELIAFAMITRDITERRATEAALHASEQRFRLLVDGVTDYAIYMLSLNGEITNWNAGAQRIKGYRVDEVIGTHFSRFYTKADRERGMPMKALATAMDTGRFESEGWRVRKDGKEFWAHVIVDPVRNDDGELIGFAKVTRDVSERRDAAEKLERAKEALFQSQKLEALGKLTGGIAHDFNNLLGVVVNGMELLSDEIKSATGRKVLDSVQRATARGTTLTQQLLSFARRQPLRPDKHNLTQIVSSFEEVLRRACGEAIRFDTVLSPALRPVSIDSTQFEAALLNLVGNARDAMPEGGTLAITTENVELSAQQIGNLPSGHYVKLAVRDSGNGMSSDVAAQAIEPFFTTKETGEGMGLSQVYGLIQQCGGDLQIDTTVGKGTVISLYLPAVEPGESAVEQAPVDAHVGNDKALIVDDQPDVLDMAVELFRNMGYQVLSANNGNDAIEILKRTPDVDVLFSDVLMPGMNGITLAQEAKRLVPDIKVLLASGYAAPAINNAALKQFSFINKPYRLSEIMKMLRKSG